MVDFLSCVLGVILTSIVVFPLLIWLLSRAYDMGARDYRKRLLQAIDETDGDNEHE